jgi:hypothetical protein
MTGSAFDVVPAGLISRLESLIEWPKLGRIEPDGPKRAVNVAGFQHLDDLVNLRGVANSIDCVDKCLP